MVRLGSGGTHHSTWYRRVTAVAFVFISMSLSPPAAHAVDLAQRVGTGDLFNNAASQHKTEVEASTVSFGNTIVSTFQAGRFEVGTGSAGIEFATSTDGGRNWITGTLPFLTIASTPPGPFSRSTDPVVAYNARWHKWMITTMNCAASPVGCANTTVSVSLSADGIAWSRPVTIASGSVDHPWIACDNNPTNPNYGQCYVSFVNAGIYEGETVTYGTQLGDGQFWEKLGTLPNMHAPTSVVTPNGQYVVVGTIVGRPFVPSGYYAYYSRDGLLFTGARIASFGGLHISTGMRMSATPALTVDGQNKLYVTWSDCRFHAGCSANDLLMSSSLFGFDWTDPIRVPIDPLGSTVDHFIPGIGADPSSFGRLAVSYYYFPQANCSFDTCELNAGIITSGDGGATWNTPIQLNPVPMKLSWLANTSKGRMVGDYHQPVFSGGKVVTVLALASPPPTVRDLDEYMVAAITDAPISPPPWLVGGVLNQVGGLVGGALSQVGGLVNRLLS